jgi:hypothetical protein
MAHRAGFLIPNASDVGVVSYRQAEPDAGDFSILGNDRYGVFYGCGLTSSGLTLALTDGPHIILVDGVVQLLPSTGSVTINTGSTTDRFDLIGWDVAASDLTVIAGVPVDDPKFAEIPDGVVVIAAVYVAAGASSINNSNVIDKRRLLLHGARGAAAGNETFLYNLLPSGQIGFSATGSGTLGWDDNSVSLGITGNKLTVNGKRFHASSGLDVTGSIEIDGSATVSGVLAASNYKRGAGDPTAAGVAGVPGDEYSRTDTGQKYIYRSGGIGWAEIYADEYPPGTIIASLLTGPAAETHMAGWLPLNGQPVNDADVGRLPDLGSPFSSWNNGNGTWTMPDLSGKVLLGGVPGATGGTGAVVLTEANLPPHKHFGGAASTGAGGGHTHPGSTSSAGGHNHEVTGGSHSHTVNDPMHAHSGNHGNNVATPFIVAEWNGQNKLDGPFNDSSHTWSVGPSNFTTLNKTGITIPTGGAHSHSVSSVAGHTHAVSVSSVGAHSHSFPEESPVGSGKPLNVVPPHLAVTYYVKI